MIVWPRRWLRRARRLSPRPELPVALRHPTPLRHERPGEGDAHADFYRQAIDIAWGVRSRILVAYHAAIIAMVVGVLSAFAAIGWQALDRSMPVRDVEQRLLTPVVARGGRVGVRYDLWRDRVCAVDVNAAIIDGAGELRPLVTLHRDVAGPPGHDGFARSWQVPPEAAPGRAKLRVGWAYACPGNYLQALSPIPLALPDLTFTIAPL